MDLFNLFQYATALILVLALALLALLARRYGNNPQAFKQQLTDTLGKGKWRKWDFKAPEKRLAVVETLMLGPKQRLIIIRRDNVEHLVMLTSDSTCVVENNIPASAPSGASNP
jgi:hypothetical protein